MKKFLTVAVALLCPFLQIHAGTGQDEGSDPVVPRGIGRSVETVVKNKLKLINAADIAPRSEATQPNPRIVEEIQKRGVVTAARQKRNIVFFTSDKIDVSSFDGNNASKPVSVDDIRKIHHCFQVSNAGRFRMRDDGYVNQIAHEWWKNNQSINYMPLRVSLLNYYNVDKDPAKNKDSLVFFAVSPIFKGASSQLVAFGFEPDFFITNTNAKVKRIALTVEGETIELAPKGTAVVGFPAKGDYTFPVHVTMQDGSTFTCAFTFSVLPLADGTWTNSRVNDDGNLEFVY